MLIPKQVAAVVRPGSTRARLSAGRMAPQYRIVDPAACECVGNKLRCTFVDTDSLADVTVRLDDIQCKARPKPK